MTSLADLEQLYAEQLRALNIELLQRLAQQEKILAEQNKVLDERDQTIRRHEVLNEKLTYELAIVSVVGGSTSTRSKRFPDIQSYSLYPETMGGVGSLPGRRFSAH